MTEGAYGKAYGKLGIVRFYALVFGIAYVGVAILELFYPQSDPLSIGDTLILQRTVLQNVFHFAVGIVVLGSFFAGERAARTVARIVGVVFAGLSLWGFIAPSALGSFFGYPGDIPLAYNVIQVATAVLALFAGFAGFAGRRGAAT
jgi:uncharacterized protein DUF4383